MKNVHHVELKKEEKECLTCNEGYFISDNSKSFVCTKCSVQFCKKCSNDDICEQCNNNFIERTNNNGDIQYCICPSNFNLINGICKEYNNWIEAEYDMKSLQDQFKIMNTRYTKINLNQIDI